MSAPTPSAGTPTGQPNPQASKINLTQIMSNIPHLIKLAGQGSLKPIQITQLRSILFKNIKQIAISLIGSNGDTQPLLNLPPSLDPSRVWEGQSPMCTAEDWKNLAANAIGEARVKVKEAAGKVQTRVAVGTSGSSTPAHSQPGSPQPSSSQASGTQQPVRPTAFMPMEEFKAMLALTPEARHALFEKDPAVKRRFMGALNSYREHQSKAAQAQSQNQAAGQATSGGLPAPTTNLHTGQAFQLALPARRERDEDRRKRKFKEYVKEDAPGMELEIGVPEVLGEVMDAFVAEAAKGAFKLARHRKAEKVELKDIAYFLDKTYSLTVPGFDVHPTERRHIIPEGDRKKGKGVAPRAARLGRGTKEED
ncbi:hypothetical protein BCR39DRAFT_526091 [Naematelia encephala]|uniref:Transcription initiation factor TFIID subunit 12 domain-containing protein n=1 Tax=Naematelia encephala TaxID=71784 RepID=A0A1Y2B9V9_9TREE|nr:hypothetical protein BCR39DRAFT_526091 [Naematelia encephala]